MARRGDNPIDGWAARCYTSFGDPYSQGGVLSATNEPGLEHAIRWVRRGRAHWRDDPGVGWLEETASQ